MPSFTPALSARRVDSRFFSMYACSGAMFSAGNAN